MALTLPALPLLTEISFELLDFGGDLRSPFGGPTQRILRFGSRYRVSVRLPEQEADIGRLVLAVCGRAKTEGEKVRMAAPQLGDTSGVVGVTAISGSGATLVKSGSGPAVGMFFSFEKSGVVYLHEVTNVAGSTLKVSPMLRADPAGLPLNFAAPVIEGLVDGVAAGLVLNRYVSQSFTIEEAQ